MYSYFKEGATLRVNIDYFFEKADRFPWDWFGGLPKLGEVHNYLGRILGDYLESNELQVLFKSPTSYRELERALKDYPKDSTLNYIKTFTESRREKEDRPSRAEEVLKGLKMHTPFVDALKKRLTEGYLRGEYKLPQEALIEDDASKRN